MRLVNGLAATLFKGPVASERLCLSVHLAMPMRQPTFFFFHLFQKFCLTWNQRP